MAFIESGKKQNLKTFKDAECLQVFDLAFAAERDYRILWRIGFEPAQIDYLATHSTKEIRNFHKALSYFEDLKISRGVERLPDGFTHKPIFLIRNLLRLLPAYLLAQAIQRADEQSAYMPGDIFCRVMAASYASKKDLELTPGRIEHIKNLQLSYLTLVGALGEPFEHVLKTLQERSTVINHRHRITGDAMVFIIEEVMAMKGKMKINGLQEALDAFIDSQVLIPGKWRPVQPEDLAGNTLKARLLQKIEANLEEFKESI
jgi:hypothetical protein